MVVAKIMVINFTPPPSDLAHTWGQSAEWCYLSDFVLHLTLTHTVLQHILAVIVLTSSRSHNRLLGV